MEEKIILNLKNKTNEELVLLMNKYKEKLSRCANIWNEEGERTQRKILLVHLEQVLRKRLAI
jgi:hypothetical protein